MMRKGALFMRKWFTAKKPWVFIAAAILLVIAGAAAKHWYERYQLTQRLKEEEIYMFQDTYMYHAFAKDVCAYYMVCEPVYDKVQLVEKLERLMEEKQVVQGVRDYYQENFAEEYGYNNLHIFVYFFKPSKEFPIGWQPVEGYDMEDYQEITDYLILTIGFPWDAESKDEHTYYFWRPNGNDEILKRQTQEDGSFILIPEN